MSHPEENKPLIPGPWRVYAGDVPELPSPFQSVLVYKGGEDAPYVGVFSGYRAPARMIWVAHDYATGAFPIEPGDRWIPFPDPPGGDA